MKFRISRIFYYLSCVVKLMSGIRPLAWIYLMQKKVCLERFDIELDIRSFLDLLLVKEVILDGEYERFCPVNQLDKAIVDVGAGIGDYAIFMAKRFPNSKIYAFEPNLNYFALLEKNIKQNNISNVTPFNTSVNSLKDLFTHTHTGIDLLKIDCEGCEFSILNSAGFKHMKGIKKITMEYHLKHGDVRSLVSLLIRARFKITQIPTAGVSEIGHIYAVKI